MIAAPLGQRATMATTTVARAGPACPHSQNDFPIPPPGDDRNPTSAGQQADTRSPRERGGGGEAGQAFDHSPSGMPVTV